MPTCTESDLDLWSDDALADPYPLYAALRAAGPVIWLSRWEMFALPRYAQVHDALERWQQFSSAHGVMLNEHYNHTVGHGNVLCSDPPLHGRLRSVARRPVLQSELRRLEARLSEEAERTVEEAVRRGGFDAVELASRLPLTVVSELVGLPEEGRERMLDWAKANFECFGPANARTLAARPVLAEALAYSADPSLRDRVRPGGWAARLFEAADAGEITPEEAGPLLSAYWAPSLDTTILATASAIRLFGEHPDQWDALRDDPTLIGSAINEVLRLESPVQMFSRLVVDDCSMAGTALGKGTRVLVMFASANRDERQFADPERFDVTRRAANHLGFGFGEHRCLGMPLAVLEMKVVLLALARRVRRLEIGTPELLVNNVLHGLRRLDVTIG